MFVCLLLENFFATTFLNSLLHVGPGTMGSCGQPPTRRGDGVQSLQLCNKIPLPAGARGTFATKISESRTAAAECSLQWT